MKSPKDMLFVVFPVTCCPLLMALFRAKERAAEDSGDSRKYRLSLSTHLASVHVR